MTGLRRGVGGLALSQGTFAPTTGVEFVGGQDSGYWNARLFTAWFIILLLILSAEGRKVAIAGLQP